MEELTPEQHEALARFINLNIPRILSDEDKLGILEPLLKIEGVIPAPKGFDDARAKLKATYDFLEPLSDWLPWHLVGDYSHQKLTIVPKKPANDLPFSIYFHVLAKKTDVGFDATLESYTHDLHSEGKIFIPGADDALGVTSIYFTDKDYKFGYGHSRLIHVEGVNKLEPQRVLNAIRAYTNAASSLRLQQPIVVKER